MSESLDQSQNSMFNPEVNYFGLTNYRNQFRKFGIKTDDRRRHMYVIGKTGMGKTTILENMVLNDIYAGHGIGLVDPHGDFAEKVLNYIPPHRINDVVYFNPSDLDFPVGFNILESINEEYRHLIASGLMGVFKKIWPDVWSARMEYILNNTILALIGYPDTTLLGINRLLSDDDYREKVIDAVKDPVVKAFWDTEFASYSDKYKQEAVAPIQNKIGQFLSASIIRNIVAQVKSTINIREIMDSRKIFIMNLSKGRIGEDSSRLLGGMLITKIQLSAMERVDTPEKERKDFFLYVDEFQNFATESFSNILSEARKYRLDLIMAHQYMEQLDEGVRAAVIGNVGTMVLFRVGSTDADVLAKEFMPTFTEEDLVNLPKFHIYLKLMIDGVASRPFSALTLPPIAAATGSMDKVLRVSRERYGTPRTIIEEKIAKWSGVFDKESGGGGAGGGGAKGSPKPSFGNKPSGGGNKSFGKTGGGGAPKNSGGSGKGKPLPPKSSPPPKIASTQPSAQPVVLVDAHQPGISLQNITKQVPRSSASSSSAQNQPRREQQPRHEQTSPKNPTTSHTSSSEPQSSIVVSPPSPPPPSSTPVATPVLPAALPPAEPVAPSHSPLPPVSVPPPSSNAASQPSPQPVSSRVQPPSSPPVTQPRAREKGTSPQQQPPKQPPKSGQQPPRPPQQQGKNRSQQPRPPAQQQPQKASPISSKQSQPSPPASLPSTPPPPVTQHTHSSSQSIPVEKAASLQELKTTPTSPSQPREHNQEKKATSSANLETHQPLASSNPPTVPKPMKPGEVIRLEE